MARYPLETIMTSLLDRTGQTWKLRSTVWTGIVGMAMTFGAVWHGTSQGWKLPAILVIFGLALWTGGFVWAALTIRCPSCGARLLWKAMRERTLLEHEHWLLSLEVCPACGSDGTLGTPVT